MTVVVPDWALFVLTLYLAADAYSNWRLKRQKALAVKVGSEQLIEIARESAKKQKERNQ